MKYAAIFSTIISVLGLTSCVNKANEPSQPDSLSSSNPFYAESKLPYQAPDFNKIKDSDFLPALEAGMRQKRSEAQLIADNPDSPTFENVLIALERSGQLLNRVQQVFQLLTGANTNPALQDVKQTVAPELTATDDAIFLNGKLFQKIETLYQRRDQLKLDPESYRLLEYYEQQFELAGARLSDDDKERLKAMNKEEATLCAQFTSKLLSATRNGALIITDSADLAGLPASTVEAAAEKVKTDKLNGKWVISLQNTTQQPNLKFLQNRSVRQKLFEASWNRAEKKDSNDTRELILQLARLRAQKAKLLGFPNYASRKLQDQMAKTPDAVQAFLNKLIPAATARAKSEAADIQAVIDREKGGFSLQPWDWDFYAEQVRKAKYDLDEKEIKPYFELDTVLQKGVFYAANLLYGLSFKPRTDIPVYQPDVKIYEVFDQHDQPIALFYCDYFKRDNKAGGAWMDNLVGQSRLMGTRPVIFNVCNFTKPAPGQPALISFTDVTTMFHEFGHALHGLFANQQYPTLSGTNVARDFVEFPSQFNEHWASDPKVFSHYAIHYKTGAAMPALLVKKIRTAADFNRGYGLTELLAAADLDFQWHLLGSGEAPQNTDSFEVAALQKSGLDLPQVPSRYRTSYFSHIWSGGGYAAGYYAYLWTQMLDEDVFAWFQQHGGLTRENGQRFRDMILSRGNTEDLAGMYRAFCGHDPDIRPMIEQQGLARFPAGAADAIIEAGEKPKRIDSSFKFTEGPAVDRLGNVFFTDQPNDKIWEYDTNGRLHLFMDKTGRSNGMYFDPKGNLISCADEDNQLWAIDRNKKVTVLIKDYQGHRLNGPNDLWIAPSGDIYLTDPYYQRDYWTRKKPDTALGGQYVYLFRRKTNELIRVDSETLTPNGIVGTPDGKYLYVADFGKGKTFRYEISGNGTLKNKQPFADEASDGMTIDDRGNIYLTGKGVDVFNPAGRKILHIDIPEEWTGNICFAGKDRNILFITASKSIYILPTRVRGVE